MPLTSFAPADASEAAVGGSPQLVGRAGLTYDRRRPERTALYQVVQNNLKTLYAAVEEGFRTASLPAFVRDEFERYLNCGLLCRGAALLVCKKEGCPGTRVVAISCKGRGWCPSCLGRRMAQGAANLVDHTHPAGA